MSRRARGLPVPTANPKRLTATANRLILAPDERSLQVDLVRLDRTVPAAGCVGSRGPCPSTSTQRAAAQIPKAVGVRSYGGDDTRSLVIRRLPMSKADQFRQYAEEAMRWACRSRKFNPAGFAR